MAFTEFTKHLEKAIQIVYITAMLMVWMDLARQALVSIVGQEETVLQMRPCWQAI